MHPRRLRAPPPIDRLPIYGLRRGSGILELFRGLTAENLAHEVIIDIELAAARDGGRIGTVARAINAQQQPQRPPVINDRMRFGE